MKQQSIVIIANGATCSSELMARYMAEKPIVIVLDGAMHRFKELGFRADYLIGDFDRDTHSFEELNKQFPGIAIKAMPDQNATDFEKGIHFACSLNPSEITVLWATGKRSDHFFMNCANLISFPQEVNKHIVDDHSVVYQLPKLFEKYFQAGQQLSLIPIGTVTGITTSNLRYPLKKESLILGQKNGNSNEVVAAGNVEISYESGSLLLMECWD
jgi:thiamine pyrophosphokinase